MQGFEAFRLTMADHGAARARKLLDSRKGDLQIVIGNHLFDLPGPRVMEGPVSDDGRFFGNLFSGFAEISTSYETLKNMASLPIQGAKLSRVQTIRLNIEFYLSEVYVLQQRLVSYSGLLKNAARRANRQVCTIALKELPVLEKSVIDSLDGVCKVRGSHIHEKRYDDDDLSRIDGLELLVRHGRMIELRSFYDQQCKAIRKKWREKIGTNNIATASILDAYFDKVYPIVFAPTFGLLGPAPQNSSVPAAS